MLDSHLHRAKPCLTLSPASLTAHLTGRADAGRFAIGVLALPFLALGWYGAALAAILLTLLDGTDGALARRRRLTDAGGFLDIALDFLFYAPVPFGFILADPLNNATGGWLLFAYRHRRAFSLCRHGGGHQIANPATPIIAVLSRGLTEGTACCLSMAACFRAFRTAGVAVWRAVLADDGDAHLQWLPDLKAGNDHSVNGVSRVADKERRAERVTDCFRARSPQATRCGLLLHSYQPPSYTATCASHGAGARKGFEARQPVRNKTPLAGSAECSTGATGQRYRRRCAWCRRVMEITPCALESLRRGPSESPAMSPFGDMAVAAGGADKLRPRADADQRGVLTMQQPAGLFGIQHQLRLAGDRRAEIRRRCARRRRATGSPASGRVCQPPSQRTA